jgi:magnesium-transporting ATPase (P-type)
MCYIRKKILCHYICVPWIIFGGIIMTIAFISFWAFGGMSALTRKLCT